jgi:hypothetical protein
MVATSDHPSDVAAVLTGIPSLPDMTVALEFDACRYWQRSNSPDADLQYQTVYNVPHKNRSKLEEWFRLHVKVGLQNAPFVSMSPPEYDVDIHRDNVSIRPRGRNKRDVYYPQQTGCSLGKCSFTAVVSDSTQKQTAIRLEGRQVDRWKMILRPRPVT